MALVVEDGTGLTNAESYISEADVDTYFSVRGNPSTWTAATTPEKEAALRRGAQYLDAQYGLRWLGARTNETQALNWPRAGIVDQDGFAIDDDAMPQALLDASAEAALRHLGEDDGLLPDVDEPGIEREKIKAGPVESDVTYAGSNTGLKRFTLIDKLLAPLISGGTRVDRG